MSGFSGLQNRVPARLMTLLAAMLLGLSACTYVPFDADRDESFAGDPGGKSSLAHIADDLSAANGGKSAFVPLIEGNDSLGARLRMINRAERSIDAQYFLIKPDHAGSLFTQALIRAARRGVRVRFLIDDVFTTATDDQIAYLDAQENIEVRLYNPLSRNSTKTVNFLLDFDRVNRRMHNKVMIVDNAMAIFGGRNIADEYFQIEGNGEFVDLDVFSSGPVVREISKTFDLFWNDVGAVPVRALHDPRSDAEHRAVGRELDEAARRAEEEIYQRAVNSTYLADVISGKTRPTFANARVVTDLPEKLRVPVNYGERLLAGSLVRAMYNSKSEMILMTPYFVPRRSGLAFFKAMEERGVRVRVITNSLASTNHAYVHGGYTPYRKDLLRAGVELYEIKEDALQALGKVPPDSDVKLTMHTKAAIFDGTGFFVGSLNFDPRSIELNTELGVFFESRELGKTIGPRLEEFIRDYTYAVSLDEEDALVWTYFGGETPTAQKTEPEATAWEKLISVLARILPVERQL